MRENKKILQQVFKSKQKSLTRMCFLKIIVGKNGTSSPFFTFLTVEKLLYFINRLCAQFINISDILLSRNIVHENKTLAFENVTSYS